MRPEYVIDPEGVTWEQVCTIKERLERQTSPQNWRIMEITQPYTGHWVLGLMRTQGGLRVEKITEWAYWQQLRVSEEL